MPQEDLTQAQDSFDTNENDSAESQVREKPRRAAAPKKETTQEPETAPFIQKLLFYFLSLFVAFALFIMLLVVDFINVYQFRHKIPEFLKERWPLKGYLAFVQLHQLPEEEKYQQLIIREQEKYKNMITQGEKTLEQKAELLEKSYKDLIRVQRERHNKQLEETSKMRQELEAQKKEFEEEKNKLEERKAKVDDLSARLASEALQIKTSLIKFMEEDNKLEEMQKIAAAMDPVALGNIFNEVPDDRLVYDILSGIPPEKAGQVISNMEADRASKIIRVGQEPKKLPQLGKEKDYIPQGLQDILKQTE